MAQQANPEIGYWQQWYNYLNTLQHGGDAPFPDIPWIMQPGDPGYNTGPTQGEFSMQDLANWLQSGGQQPITPTTPYVPSPVPNISDPRWSPLPQPSGGVDPRIQQWLNLGQPSGGPTPTGQGGTPVPGQVRDPAWESQGIDSSLANLPFNQNTGATYPNTLPTQYTGIPGLPNIPPILDMAMQQPASSPPASLPPGYYGPGVPYVPPGAGQSSGGDMAGKTTDAVTAAPPTPDEVARAQGFANYMDMAQRLGDIPAQQAWQNALAQQRAAMMPYTYNGGFIPYGNDTPVLGGNPYLGGVGGGGGGSQAGGSSGGSQSSPWGYGTGGSTGEQVEQPTSSGTSGNGATAAPTGGGIQPPTFTPTPPPAPPTFNQGPSGAGGTTAVPNGQGGTVQVPNDWLQYLMGGGQTGGLPPITIPDINIPPFPTQGTTTGGQPTTPTVPQANLPPAPDFQYQPIQFPDIPTFNPSPLPNPQNLQDIYNRLAQGQQGGTAGGPSGGLFPGNPPGTQGAGGGAPSSGNPFMDYLYGEYQRSQDEARAANETRYNDILDLYGQRLTNSLDMLGNLGLTEKNQIKEAYERTRGATAQSLTSRGLSNTTVLPSVLRGVDTDYTRNMGELQQRINATGLNAYGNLSGDMLGFMERREDPGPDQNMLALLAQGLGEAGYGYGGQGTTGGSGSYGTGTTQPQPTGTSAAGSSFAAVGGQGTQPSEANLQAQRASQNPMISGNNMLGNVGQTANVGSAMPVQSLGSVGGGQPTNTGDMNPIYDTGGSANNWSQFGYNNNPASSANNWSSPSMPQTGGGIPLPNANFQQQAGNVDYSITNRSMSPEISNPGGYGSSGSPFQLAGMSFDNPQQAYGWAMSEAPGQMGSAYSDMMNAAPGLNDQMSRQKYADANNAVQNFVFQQYPSLQGVMPQYKPKPMSPANQQYFSTAGF